MQTIVIGKRGTVVIPSALRKELRLAEGAPMQIEKRDGGLFLRPVVAEPEVEIYTPARLAEFFLNNVMTKDGYEEARKDVIAMGIDPDTIDHYRWAE
jgi:AbrB family looped-hinge helix DNA binding protein